MDYGTIEEQKIEDKFVVYYRRVWHWRLNRAVEWCGIREGNCSVEGCSVGEGNLVC